MRLAKLLSLLLVGVVIMVLSLVVRWILIIFNTRRKPVYTAEYQNKIYQFMNERKGLEQQASASGAQQSDRNLLADLDTLELVPCGVCGKEIAHGNKNVDTVTACKHKFHAMCLKSSMNSQLFSDSHSPSRCPQCKRTLYEMRIHCQGCRGSSRNVLMEDKYCLCKVNSFTCFRCVNERRWQVREERVKQCCGAGRYFYCYCLRDF